MTIVKCFALHLDQRGILWSSTKSVVVQANEVPRNCWVVKTFGTYGVISNILQTVQRPIREDSIPVTPDFVLRSFELPMSQMPQYQFFLCGISLTRV